MTLLFWRRGAKFAAIVDIIYSAAVLVSIIGIAAVEAAVQKIEKKNHETKTAVTPANGTDTEFEEKAPVHTEYWKLLVGGLAACMLTILHIWFSVRLYTGASPEQPLESAKRKAIVWIFVKILLDILGIVLEVVIFAAYILVGVSIAMRILLLAIVIKYVKEVKAAINTG